VAEVALLALRRLRLVAWRALRLGKCPSVAGRSGLGADPSGKRRRSYFEYRPCSSPMSSMPLSNATVPAGASTPVVPQQEFNCFPLSGPAVRDG
jgi:hypothetical protein